MINELLTALEKSQKQEPVRYGIYYKGAPVYISTVNVYKNKKVARSKIKDYCRSYTYNANGYVKTTISDEDLQNLLDKKVIEIKPIV